MWSPVCSQFCNPQSIWYENKKDTNNKKFDKKCLGLFKKEMKSFYIKVYRKFKNMHSTFTLFSNIQYNNLCLWYYQKKSQETKNARNDARTKRCPQWYCNDRKFCESSNYIKNKSSNIECPEYEVPSSWNPNKIRFKLSRKWMKTLTLKDAWFGALFLNILFQINGL